MPTALRTLRGSVALLALLVAGCGQPANRLTGSLSDVFDLHFDTVAVSLVGGFLVVEYDVTQTGAKAIKLSVNLTGYTVAPGSAIDLAAPAPSGSPRGTLEQIAAAHTAFPFDQGSLTLDRAPTGGAPLTGQFDASLTQPAGRSLRGAFQVASVVKE